MSTISDEVRAELGPGITKLSPFSMLNLIAEHMVSDCTAEEHDRLLRRAQATRIRRNEDISSYLKRHRELRNQMRVARYPNINRKSPSVLFAVQGLQARPSMTKHVPLLLMQRIETFKKLETAVQLLRTLDLPRQPTRRPSVHDWAVAPGPSTRNVPMEGGWQQYARGRSYRARGRPGRGQARLAAEQRPAGNRNQAMAVQTDIVHEEPWTDTVDAMSAQPEHRPAVNQDDFGTYYIDSACEPRITRLQAARSAHRECARHLRMDKK